jgi:hypothetical protein
MGDGKHEKPPPSDNPDPPKVPQHTDDGEVTGGGKRESDKT